MNGFFLVEWANEYGAHSKVYVRRQDALWKAALTHGRIVVLQMAPSDSPEQISVDKALCAFARSRGLR